MSWTSELLDLLLFWEIFTDIIYKHKIYNHEFGEETQCKNISYSLIKSKYLREYGKLMCLPSLSLMWPVPQHPFSSTTWHLFNVRTHIHYKLPPNETTECFKRKVQLFYNPPPELTLLVYLAISAATSAEAVAIGRSVLREEESVLADPELVTMEIGWVLVTKVMVDVEVLCVISFCCTAKEREHWGDQSHKELWKQEANFHLQYLIKLCACNHVRFALFIQWCQLMINYSAQPLNLYIIVRLRGNECNFETNHFWLASVEVFLK